MKIFKFLKNNKISISMFLIGISLGALVMSFFIPERISPLKNGEMPIVTFNDFAITSNEYYEYLKSINGIDYLIYQIDQKILDKMYETTSEIKKEVQIKMHDTIKEYTDYYGYTENDFLQENGFKTEEEFYNLMLLEHKRSLYVRDYIKDNITNAEVNNYYIKDLTPDMEIKYISGSENVLDKILDELKNNNYDDIVKKYQKNIKYKDYSYVSFDNQEINQDIYSEAFFLEENSYTKTLVSINGVYYIIFKGDVKEKDDVEKLSERIKEKIIDKKLDNDTTNELYNKALINLRKENGIIFNDTILKDEYDNYINSFK